MAKQTVSNLVAMYREYNPVTGGVTTAQVHPDEVNNWVALGWRIV